MQRYNFAKPFSGGLCGGAVQGARAGTEIRRQLSTFL